MNPPFTAKHLLRTNTADTLLKKFPELEKDKGWANFAKEYDKPEHQKARLRAFKICIKAQPSKKVVELKRLCDIVRTEEWIIRAEAGLTPHMTHVEANQVRLAAGAELANHLELIFSGGEQGKKMLRFMEAEIERIDLNATSNCITDCCLALLEFIHREGRLPFKGRLNLEAGHLLNCTKIPLEKSTHGSIVEITGLKYFVYDCREVTVFSEKSEGLHTKIEGRVVPYFGRLNTRWNDSDFSTLYLLPSGLRGLPKAPKGQLGTR